MCVTYIGIPLFGNPMHCVVIPSSLTQTPITVNCCIIFQQRTLAKSSEHKEYMGVINFYIPVVDDDDELREDPT